MVHTDGYAVDADIALPSHRNTRFDGDASCDRRRQHALAVLLRLRVEKLPRRHADDAHVDAVVLELISSLERKMHLASGSDENQLIVITSAEDVAALVDS